MIEKISIFILICNLNFIANFPIEDFSFDYNKSEANESKDIVVHKGAVDVNFELIHENDENEKVIKKRDANDQENSAENHINHKDNHNHHSNGFSYQRPSNIPKDSVEIHYHHYGTKTTKYIKHTEENSEHSLTSTVDHNELKKSTTVVGDTEDDYSNSDQYTTDYSQSAKSQTNDVKDSSSIHSTTVSFSDENHPKTYLNTNPRVSTTTATFTSRIVKTLSKTVESSPECEDSVEDNDENTKNFTKRLDKTSHFKTTQSLSHTYHQNLTTNIEKSEEKVNKIHQNPGKHDNRSKYSTISDHPNLRSTKFQGTSTRSYQKTSSENNITKSSTDTTQHQYTKKLATTRHNLLSSTDSFIRKSTSHPKTTHGILKTSTNTFRNQKTTPFSHELNSKSLKSNSNVTYNPNHNLNNNNSNHDVNRNPKHNTSQNHDCNDNRHDPNHNFNTTHNPYVNSHYNTSPNPRDSINPIRKLVPSQTHTTNPANHKIIHTQETTHFDEWTIADKGIKVESQEDNKLGSRRNLKKSTTHRDAVHIVKTSRATTIPQHEVNNHIHQKTETTTEQEVQRIRFAIPRVPQKQNQGMKNEENSKFDHNQLDDDVEIFKMTEKSITVGGKRQTDKHSFKFVG